VALDRLGCRSICRGGEHEGGRELVFAERFRGRDADAASGGHEGGRQADRGHEDRDDWKHDRSLTLEHFALQELLQRHGAQHAAERANRQLTRDAREHARENTRRIAAERRADADFPPPARVRAWRRV
jgi:hypothetical protein